MKIVASAKRCLCRERPELTLPQSCFPNTAALHTMLKFYYVEDEKKKKKKKSDGCRAGVDALDKQDDA